MKERFLLFAGLLQLNAVKIRFELRRVGYQQWPAVGTFYLPSERFREPILKTPRAQTDVAGGALDEVVSVGDAVRFNPIKVGLVRLFDRLRELEEVCCVFETEWGKNVKGGSAIQIWEVSMRSAHGCVQIVYVGDNLRAVRGQVSELFVGSQIGLLFCLLMSIVQLPLDRSPSNERCNQGGSRSEHTSPRGLISEEPELKAGAARRPLQNPISRLNRAKGVTKGHPHAPPKNERGEQRGDNLEPGGPVAKRHMLTLVHARSVSKVTELSLHSFARAA